MVDMYSPPTKYCRICYKCRHRGEALGSVHTKCEHPNADELKVKGDKYGKERGWFSWPHNFDPCWLNDCSGVEFVDGEDFPEPAKEAQTL